MASPLTPHRQPSAPSIPPSSSAFSSAPLPATPTSLRRAGTARDLLRAHYGIDGGSPRSDALNFPATKTTGSASDASSESMDPLDLDSPAFDPHRYYATLLSSRAPSVADLLGHETTLRAQIRRLDAERHALVAEHFGELVAASETIQRMNSRASPLTDSLDSLRTAFSAIAQLVEAVALPPATPSPSSSSFSGPSGQQVKGAENDDGDDHAPTPARCRHMADLPERLADLLVLDRPAEARTHLARARPTLERWREQGTPPGAAKLLAECERVMESAPQKGGGDQEEERDAMTLGSDGTGEGEGAGDRDP